MKKVVRRSFIALAALLAVFCLSLTPASAAVQMNWGGYVYTGSGLTSVAGEMVVSTPTACASNGSQNGYVADWVGIDWGPGVEQTGLTVNCTNGVTSVAPWYEVYPAIPVTIPLATNPGNHVIFTVIDYRGSTYEFVVQNVTTGKSWFGSAVASAARNVTVECITEYLGHHMPETETYWDDCHTGSLHLAPSHNVDFRIEVNGSFDSYNQPNGNQFVTHITNQL